MMKKVLLIKYGVFFAVATALLLSVCGYKSDLYLPKEDDKACFGVIQIDLKFDTAKEPTTQTND